MNNRQRIKPFNTFKNREKKQASTLAPNLALSNIKPLIIEKHKQKKICFSTNSICFAWHNYCALVVWHWFNEQITTINSSNKSQK